MKNTILLIAIVILLMSQGKANAYYAFKENTVCFASLATAGLFLNYNVPAGDDDRDGVISWGAKMSMPIKININGTANVLDLTYTEFDFASESAVKDSSIDFWGLNYRRRSPFKHFFAHFFTIGIGDYIDDDSDGSFGINAGLGLIYKDFPSFNLALYHHHVFNTGSDTTFHEVRAGITFLEW